MVLCDGLCCCCEEVWLWLDLFLWGVGVGLCVLRVWVGYGMDLLVCIGLCIWLCG